MNLKDAIFGGSVTGVSDRSGAYEGSIQAWLPIKDIVQGVVVTRDKRFIKILELLPVNFYTMSSTDKSAAIEDFAAFLKIAPANIQINVLTQPFDLNGYLKLLRDHLERETNERCRDMLLESIEYVPQLVEREALTHRFFLSFSYDPSMKAADHTPEAIAAVLNEKAEVARRYLDRCGVTVLEPEYADNFVLELFYKLLNKRTSQQIQLPEGVFDMLGTVHGIYDEEMLKGLEAEPAEPVGKKRRRWFQKKPAAGLSRLEAGATTIPDLLAPPDIDTHHADYLLIDGVYHAYLYISGYGYATVVGKGWLTPLIEAGEGVSLSFRLVKQPREKTVSAIGQTTMINRSRMRDVGDTRQDFEELGDAIGAGLYLKEGMNREGQDFYYMHTLIEVVADDPATLEQRVTAVETLCVASDMLAKRCEYKHEQAFLSFLPLLISDPDIERKSRRNALTFGVAAAFPFASYELSDQKGIFLGLNLYNHSPVFIDMFDDYKYTNGNFAGFGNSGVGKSTLFQCIGKRLREQQRRVVYIVPEKGHEYRPLCEAMGGQYVKLGPSSPDCIGLMEIRRLKNSSYGSRSSGIQGRESLLAEKVSWLSVWYSLQKRNLTEEDMNYPKTEWEELIGCTDIQICLGCNDVDTATYISKKCGMVTIRVENNQMPMQPLFSPIYNTTRPYSQTKSNTQRALMLPDEIMRMDNRESLVLLRGQKPLKLYKIRPDEHPSFQHLRDVRVSDYVPEWRRKEEAVKAAAVPSDTPAPPEGQPSPAPEPPPRSQSDLPAEQAGAKRAPEQSTPPPQSGRQEFDYGLLDPEPEGTADIDAPYGAFDLIETLPEDVGGP